MSLTAYRNLIIVRQKSRTGLTLTGPESSHPTSDQLIGFAYIAYL